MGFDRTRRTLGPVGGTPTYEFARLLASAECRGDAMEDPFLHGKRTSNRRAKIYRSECRLRQLNPRSNENMTNKSS